MRARWVCLAAVLAAGCSRSFTQPASQPNIPQPLRTDPAALTVAVNEEAPFRVLGGSEPYQVGATVDAGPECGPAPLADGGWVYRACLRPLAQDVVDVVDADEIGRAHV